MYRLLMNTQLKLRLTEENKDKRKTAGPAIDPCTGLPGFPCPCPMETNPGPQNLSHKRN